jgi:hypothetical protein
MRATAALFLSLVLTLWSVSVASAHVQMATGQSVALCSENGVRDQILDAAGNPVPDIGHLCPDCLGGGDGGALPPVLAIPSCPPRLGAAVAFTPPPQPIAQTRASASARGPPALFL